MRRLGIIFRGVMSLGSGESPAKTCPATNCENWFRLLECGSTFFSPLVIALASICFIRRSVSWQRWVGVASGVVGLGALSLALYRGYFSSLGL